MAAALCVAVVLADVSSEEGAVATGHDGEELDVSWDSHVENLCHFQIIADFVDSQQMEQPVRRGSANHHWHKDIMISTRKKPDVRQDRGLVLSVTSELYTTLNCTSLWY